jgi:hypothetical protein
MESLSEHNAVDLFRRVRAGTDAMSILSSIRDGDMLLQMRLVPETRLRYELPYSRNLPARLLVSGSPYLDSSIHEATLQPVSYSGIRDISALQPQQRILPDVSSLLYQSQYVKPYHAAVFIEPRLENARPSEWTAVCKDDVLLRDLLASYFTHEYHLLPSFHKDYFLEDMSNAQQTKTRRMPLCSELLVNATLACACVSWCCKRTSRNNLTLSLSTAMKKTQTDSDTGNPKLSDIDSSLRQNEFGSCRLLMANTALWRLSRPRCSSMSSIASPVSTNLATFGDSNVLLLPKRCGCLMEMLI